MAEESNITLPENDDDRILARKIGNQLTSSSGFQDIDDSLLDLLAVYDDSEQKRINSLSNRAGATWENISDNLADPPAGRIIPLYRRSAFRAWVAEAAILLIAFIGIYWYLQPATQLIAESGAAIEEITLPDGSNVTLRPYSSLYHSNDRNYTLEGEGFFTVEHDPERPFTVEVGDARITVLGTRFNASTWGNRPKVFLEEGNVRFEDISSGDTVELQPGQASTFQQGQLQVSESNTDRENPYTDWMSNTLILDNSSFDEVVAEIEQHFNINITKSEPGFQADSINGSYRLISVDSTLSDIGLLVNGTFRKQSGNTYIFENTE